MSNDALNAAWLSVGLTPPEKLVLARLADMANPKSGACWPGQSKVARECGLSIRAVRDALHSLVLKGHISVESVATYTTPARYKIHPTPPAPDAGPALNAGEEQDAAHLRHRMPPPSGTTCRLTQIQPKLTHGALPSAEDPFEALAILEGWSPTTPLTKSAGGKVGQSLKDIQTVHPNVTGTEIRARIAAYKREFPRVAVTASSIAKHWQRLKPKGAPQPLPEGFVS